MSKKVTIDEFNDKVIEILKSKDSDGNAYKVVGIDLGSPNIATTHIVVNNVPSLVVVQLSDDSKKSLVDRVKDILVVIRIPDVDTVNRLHNWLTMINNQFTNEAINNLGDDQLAGHKE